MLSAIEQAIREFWVSAGRPPELVEYTPYLLGIASILLWFLRGLTGDCVRDLRYRLRRRTLRVVPGRPIVDPGALKIRSRI